MRHISILGSTGSVGTQALDVIAANPERFCVDGLAAYHNDELLEKQMRLFQPAQAVLVDKAAAERLRKRYQGTTEILDGEDALLTVATLPATETVLTAMVGFVGLKPTLAAIDAGKTIALANKETLVAAGEIVMQRAREKQVKILPVDSEHSAIYQALNGESRQSVSRLILTASGGPFRGFNRQQLASVTIADCLRHPNWSMGKKITVDSATLVNKGLEVIEAHWLFDVDYDSIVVSVHPQSIVHSMVEYIDGSVIAQLGQPDMRVPIQYAFSYPERLRSTFPRLDFHAMKDLTFAAPDMDTFPSLRMAVEAGRTGGTLPCVFNAANEEAVAAFLTGNIGFLAIYQVIEQVMASHQIMSSPVLEEIFAANDWARAQARKIIDGMAG
ncbi:MAG TPA: 1-deoxy-D-xylulose-5-phosphate reductoisomerase [Patescibacteria group bacterium]|nr:1-deoxy-D-xylulose-5-phosphate reductoisomerase [Patescibacteria group bacterium]